MTKSKPVFEGLMLRFAISYLLLLRSTCHDPSFMPHYPFLSVSQPRYIWATDLLSLTLTGSHRQMCPCLRYMLSMVLSVGCECMVSLVHKAWFDDEFFLQPLRIYKTVVKKSHLFWQRPQYCACLLLLSNAFARVILPTARTLENQSTPISEFVSMQSDTSFLSTSASVFESNCMMWGTMRYKVQWQHSTSEAKGLSGTLSCSTPHFFPLRKQQQPLSLRFWPCWVMTEDWAESALPGWCWYFV